jgi:hypothetical protein
MDYKLKSDIYNLTNAVKTGKYKNIRNFLKTIPEQSYKDDLINHLPLSIRFEYDMITGNEKYENIKMLCSENF